MKRTIAVLFTLSVLVAPGAALAGGWATAGLSSLPADMRPGERWAVDVEVLQHGRTPLEGVEPFILLERGSEVVRFAARPTGEPGVYRAEVLFPAAGSWKLAVDDGFGGRHSFGSHAVEGPSAAPASFPAWPLAAALALLVAASGFAVLVARRGGRSVSTS